MSGRLPDFLGIGAQKAGTTWLFKMLNFHPQVAFPAGKEVHFWDWHRDRGLDWYREQFAHAPAGARTGDITPGYAAISPAGIAEVRRTLPDAPILFIARNPIERAWSAAIMIVRWGLMYPRELSDAWFLDVFRSGQSQVRGDYAGCLARWMAEYPPEQFAILLYDDIATDPRGLLRRACVHVGVDPELTRGWPDERLTERVNAGDGEPLRESLRQPLRDLYAPRIETFSRLIGRDLSHWLD